MPDTETQATMQRFYRALREGGSKLAALHEAQLGLLREHQQKGSAAHRFFWASFILVGDPD